MSDNDKMPYTQVDLLRHGHCEGGEIFRGSTDVRLDDQGWQQMQSSVEGLEWDQIVTSPLLRCRLFAEQLSAEQGIPLHIDDRWREFNFGVWEGRLREQVWAEHADELLGFFSDPMSCTPEGGESYTEVLSRVEAAWSELVVTYANQRVLVITHGGIFRALHAALKSLPSTSFNSLEVPYACLSRWKHYDDLDSTQARQHTMLSFHNTMQS